MTIRVDNSGIKNWKLHVAARVAGITPAQLAEGIASQEIPGRTHPIPVDPVRLLATDGLVNGHDLEAWLATPEGAAKILELQEAQP
ncbi:hypothetical protein GmRootV213_18290 [Variovorax sp. V213]|uniref:hypothetical protein n=1 Tax=Variovorax sp. V213 TaxID=3065955 RepID=UPI0034E88A2B